MRRRDGHSGLLLPEVADRQAIRELVDGYAYCVDRHDAPGLLALFTEDAEFVVYADRDNPVPIQRVRGRAALASICHQLNAYQATTHINGQSTTWVDGARASGVTGCLVHHVKTEGAVRTMVFAAVRYLDAYVKRDSTWLIRQRQVIIEWTETKTLTTG